MKTKTKPTPRARRMWANYYGQNFLPALHPSKKASIQHCAPSVQHKSIPVAVIPLDDVEALVRTAGDAFAASYDGHLCKSDIVAMLAAIGVLPKSKGGRK